MKGDDIVEEHVSALRGELVCAIVCRGMQTHLHSGADYEGIFAGCFICSRAFMHGIKRVKVLMRDTSRLVTYLRDCIWIRILSFWQMFCFLSAELSR